MNDQIADSSLQLSIGKQEIPKGNEYFGFLRGSEEFVTDGTALRDRLEEDGYLYLRGVLNRSEVLSARTECMGRLMAEGILEEGSDPVAGIAAPGRNGFYFRESLADNNPSLDMVLYDGPMMDVMARIFDAPVRHFDFTWMRAVGPGNGTDPHCDAVYMNRGSDQLLTVWTPLGDLPIEQGGLVILEKSHRERQGKLENYLRQDVDSYCANGPNAEAIQTGKMGWEHYDGSFTGWSGALDGNANRVQQMLGGRWLTSPEYRMGDILVFTMATVHASLDNRSDRIRLSSDTRYQPATDPVDERWVIGPNGERPVAHGIAGKRKKIC